MEELSYPQFLEIKKRLGKNEISISPRDLNHSYMAFQSPLNYLSLVNDGDRTLAIEIGDSLTLVKKGESFESAYPEFDEALFWELLCHYDFNDAAGGEVPDLSGNEFDLTYEDVTVVDGIGKNSFKALGGDGSQGEIIADSALKFTNKSSLRIEFDFMITEDFASMADDVYYALVSSQYGSGDGWHVSWWKNHGITFRVGSENTTIDDDTLVRDKLYKIVARFFNGGDMQLYLYELTDGAYSQLDFSYNINEPALFTSGLDPLRLLGKSNGTATGLFPGIIDNVRIFVTPGFESFRAFGG